MKNRKAFIDYCQTIDDVCENLEHYKRKVLIVFYDIIADMKANSTIVHFSKCYLSAPQTTLCHSRGESLTNSILINAF